MSAERVENTITENQPANASNATTKSSSKKIEVPEGHIRFSFRKTKDPDTNEEIAAPDPIMLKYEALTISDVENLIKGSGMTEEEAKKVRELIVEKLNDVQLEYIKTLFDDIGHDEVRAKGIDPSSYAFKLIALLPPTSRGASGIPDESWDMFEKDYVEVMQHNGLDEKRAKVGANIIRAKFNKVKLNKGALEQFRDRVKTWFSNTEKGEELQSIYDYSIRRVEKLIAANEPLNVLASF